ncbi:hypothetical protein BDN72DRAFT_767273 [Pluteus cervinus]|uniref:Uncharacterized protein n=1 Tax=Pluteus cervinus TaxID=181527 RepID=A0ACD3AWG7_9AGAR|nr:hypothetical protein BDN72DRAFT_767273 [Pluteus cervinus]
MRVLSVVLTVPKDPNDFYGRHRQSIADLEEQLHNIFLNHPKSYTKDSGDPVIPADALVDVFRAFSELYDGVQLMTEEETGMLEKLLASNPGLEVTPQILLGFVAGRTKHTPPRSPAPESDLDLPGRGRSEDRTEFTHSRSSSGDSSGTSSYPMSQSRRSSLGPPHTPGTSSKGPSPFDTERRQRSTPLNNAAPSSWSKRPVAAHRRKSDAGSRSDSDVSANFSLSPSVWRRTSSKSRAPSIPSSPTPHSPEPTFTPIGSPPSYSSGPPRPHSRAHSQPQSHFANSSFFGHPGDDMDDLHSSTQVRDENNTITSSDQTLYDFPHHMDDGFAHSISSLPMPRKTSDDSDSDGEDESALGLVMDRSATSSTVSMEPIDRVDVLQRANTELGRKLQEAERTLHTNQLQHEQDMDDMQSKLDEMKSELTAARREEKELKAKERQMTTQINALESEIAKLSKALEQARTAYASLQRQYAEQCELSERYRDDLRQREEVIRNMREAASLHELENGKWARERESYEERLVHLEAELVLAQQAHAQLDEQKQENLLLKETIDRMRFDMDEMRNNITAATGQSSAPSTMSKSLGAELLGKMKGGWGLDDEEEHIEEEQQQIGNFSADLDGDDTEGEDVIQTIITRKTRKKVASRANKLEHTTFEEVKEYSDNSTQYDLSAFFVSHASQTEPPPKIITASMSMQTDPPPTVESFSIQTDPEPVPPPRITLEMEIQTEPEPEPEPVASTSTIEDSRSSDESDASSSSTVVPPTPKPHLHTLPEHADQPPAYNQINAEEAEWRATAEVLKKYHPGVKIPLGPVPGGISQDTVEDWKALKDELGGGCSVLDKVIEQSEKVSAPRFSRSSKRSSSRFYNIYNTYVYGDKSGAGVMGGNVAIVGLGLAASFVVGYALSNVQTYAAHTVIPGAPTYYDRAVWSSFNAMDAAGEGFGADGTAAVWNVLGRVGGGAARMVRGWPT